MPKRYSLSLAEIQELDQMVQEDTMRHPHNPDDISPPDPDDDYHMLQSQPAAHIPSPVDTYDLLAA